MAKFRPSLLDTLLGATQAGPDAEADPNSVIPGIRLYSLDRMTEAAFVDTLRRDLAWLLNTVRLEDTVDLDNSPRVASSVLNYGIPDFSVRTVASVNLMDAAAAIARAVKAFEPRIDAQTLKVSGKKQTSDDNLPALIFNIVCDIGKDTEPLHADFKTRMNVETGDVDLEPQR